MLAASWMTSQGVSSFSSYSAATGRMTFSAKSWTHFCICSWSSLRSRLKSLIGVAPSVHPCQRATGSFAAPVTKLPGGNRIVSERNRVRSASGPDVTMGRCCRSGGSPSRSEGGSRVDDASFSLHAGDTVGLVGRNGAGKTSMLKVIAGEAPAAARRGAPAAGAWATSPRTRRPAGSGVDVDRPLARALRPRLRRGDPAHREAAAAHRGGRRPSATSRGSHAPRSSSATTAGTAPSRRCARIAAGLGLGDDRLDLPITALSGGERRRVELARILFAGSDAAAARRADQPPRRRRQAVAHGLPAQLPRRAARRSATTSSCSTRRSRACCTSTRASSSSTRAPTRSTSRHARPTRSAAPSSRRARRPRSPARHARRQRCAARPRSGPRPRSRSTPASRKLVQNQVTGPEARAARRG